MRELPSLASLAGGAGSAGADTAIGGDSCAMPKRKRTGRSTASCPLLSLGLRLHKLSAPPAAETGERHREKRRRERKAPARPPASCVGWPAPGR